MSTRQRDRVISEVNGVQVAPGTKSVVRIPVCTDLDGTEIALHVHAVVGARPGPVLAVLTASHGRHWFSTEITRRFVESLSPEDMSGTILAVPVANPVAMADRSRHINDESDSPDVNRVFGIGGTFIANQIADAITDHVLRQADVQVALSAGPFWAVRSTAMARDFTDPWIAEESFRLARSFGIPFIRRSNSLAKSPGMSTNFAGERLGVPGFLAELGGLGFGHEVEEGYFEGNLRGLHSTAAYMGILDAEQISLDRYLLFEKHLRLNPKNGGILEPLIGPGDLMTTEFGPGDLLARVWSPFNFEVVEEIRSPVRGLVDMVTPSYPVRPGDWSSMMVDLDDPEVRWLATDEMP